MAKDIGIKPGDKFGRLTVIERGEDYITPSTGRKRTRFICECSCPEHNRILVVGSDLIAGKTHSCGCLTKEAAQKVGKANTTHGLSDTPVAQAYYNMKYRCNNPDYDFWDNYGGRGVSICPQWDDPKTDLKQFYDDMASTYFPGASLDRIDVNGDYCLENCRWATSYLQSNNTTRNKYLTVEGDTYTESEWNRAMGYTKDRVRNRVQLGWSPEKAVFGDPEAAHGAVTAHNAIYFIDRYGRPCKDQEYWQKGDYDDSEFDKLK